MKIAFITSETFIEKDGAFRLVNTKRPIIIVFVGHTVAGKTTHIRVAFSELKKERYGVYKTHAKQCF